MTDNFTRKRPDWMADANCRGLNTDLFFPNRGEPTDDLRQICRRCDVQTECLTYALDNDEDKGIWGGLSGRERRQIKSPRVRIPRPIDHGTMAGHAAHLRRDEPPCNECREASNRYQVDRRAALRGDVA
jgi:WhiB family redox-sensing transcriptional regulator